MSDAVLSSSFDGNPLFNPFPGTLMSQGPKLVALEPWRYFLARSTDMTILGELRRAKGRGLTVDNNKSGSASFGYPMGHQLAPLIKPWRTCVIAQRGYQDAAKWFWSGPVSNVVRDYGAGTLQVDAVGWFDLLLHRLIEQRTVLGMLDAGAIVFALLALANAARDTHISSGTSEVTQPRTRTYEIDANIGQSIQELAELESGYDWYIDPRTRELNIVAKRGVDRPACKWLFIADGRANKGNLRNVVETEDGSTLVNEQIVRGKFASASASGIESQDYYDVLFQESTSLSDVADSDILNAYANAEIVYRQNPRLTYSIVPKPHTVPGTPMLFRDYEIGDTTYLTMRRGEFATEGQAVRIFGATMTIDEFGVETITDLKTSPT